MPMSSNHETGPSLRLREWDEILNILNKGRFFSLENSTRYGAFLRNLLNSNMTLSNNSRMDNISDYEQDPADGHDGCSPFMDVLDFLHLYYIPAIILTGTSALCVSRYLVTPAQTVKIAFF
jgi:hypothetical protein